MNRIFDRLREREAFRTHTPEFFEPGQVVEDRGRRWRITRLRRVAPTLMLGGNVTPCWAVRGVRV